MQIYGNSDLPIIPNVGDIGKRTPPKSEFQKLNEKVVQALSKSPPTLEAPKTQGGHGGFYVTSVMVEGEEKKLFLKPFDGAEYANFSFIQNQCAGREDNSILKFMPRVYGEITLGDLHFMVMENLRGDEKTEQVADLKITRGGQYDLDELKATGRKPKKMATKVILTAQKAQAPNYLTLTKSKIKRTVTAAKSESAFQENLQDALKELDPEKKTAALKNLSKQLDEVAMHLRDSPMAFIGASIFIFKDKTGDLKVYLADPAHGQANPDHKDKYKDVKLYWGKNDYMPWDQLQFSTRKKDNIAAVQAMKSTVDDTLRPKTETKIDQTRRITRMRQDSIKEFKNLFKKP